MVKVVEEPKTEILESRPLREDESFETFHSVQAPPPVQETAYSQTNPYESTYTKNVGGFTVSVKRTLR